MGEFMGRRGIITGATKGIGWAIASRFARLDADLAICGRDPKDAQDAQDQLGEYGSRHGVGYRGGHD